MPEIRFTVPGSIVSKKNSKIACMIGGRNCPRRPMILPSKAYSKWEKQAKESLRWEKFMTPRTGVPIQIEAHFYYKGNKPDLSGACESIADMLQGLIYDDDGQIESWDGSRTHHDLKNPRTEITIRWGDTPDTFQIARDCGL